MTDLDIRIVKYTLFTLMHPTNCPLIIKVSPELYSKSSFYSSKIIKIYISTSISIIISLERPNYNFILIEMCLNTAFIIKSIIDS